MAARRRLGPFLALLAALPPTATGAVEMRQPARPEAVLLAAGDIAECGVPGASLTAALIERLPGTVLAAGDLAYPAGSAKDFARCYAPTWGKFRDRTLPVPGNHEYRTPEAAGYFAYFGPRAGEPGKGYYSVNMGHWHIVAVNSNLDSGPDSEQMRWLRRDLAQNRLGCILAFWHHPRYSSGPHGDDTRMDAVWDVLYRHGASVVIAGHDHDYERLAPLDAAGRRDDRRGIRSFVVGTGGARLYGVSMRGEESEAWNGTTWGVLKLSLYPKGYDWAFVPVAGASYRDAGSGRCNDTARGTDLRP